MTEIPYPDYCRECRALGGLDPIHEPIGVDVPLPDGAVFAYRCEKGHRWTCNYSADEEWDRYLLAKDPQAFITLR
jgi:hypothetical protein